MTKGLRTAHYAVSVAVIAAALVFGGNLSAPATLSSEIGFSSFSPRGAAGGAVIPASCESGFEHFPGECDGPGGPGGPGGPPPPAPTVDVKVNGSDGPLSFEALAGYTASWTSTNADSCSASGAWSGARPVSGSEGFSDVPRGTYDYTLTCTGPGGQGSDAVQVTVIQVPQCTFAPNPGSIILPETATLSWSCQFADSCSVDQGIGSVNPVSGNREVQPQETTLYTLACQGADGQRNYPGTVRVFSPSLREILPR